MFHPTWLRRRRSRSRTEVDDGGNEGKRYTSVVVAALECRGVRWTRSSRVGHRYDPGTGIRPLFRADWTGVRIRVFVSAGEAGDR